MHTGKARAYTNIALIKYWGKKDEELILPMNNSLSLTLDAFYTETTVSFDPALQADTFLLDGQLQNTAATAKISRFLDLLRELAGTKLRAAVTSENFVPTAAGLASSASGLAALAAAGNAALQLGLDDSQLSRLARRGSGSACRSIFGGFVEWEQGTDDITSLAHPLAANGFENDLAMLFVLINDKQKDVSSRDGMRRTVATSAFYPGWLASLPEDLAAIKQAIATQDFTALGRITEANGLKMHATTLAAVPPFTYWSPQSLLAMDLVRQLRATGTECYFTMDAGPNVKVLCRRQDEAAVQQAFSNSFSSDRLILAHAGPGISYL
ncbi:diphosphomevalonate decarboxylase [Enterococcus diestrammenae]|uniref:diphosphomevalonate decarboxylase n=1 Tax=Enterococcus diestrammenae TaxID=1155073 RepID=A0ABV0F7M3_9ENTE|nr:diphosphomevalonate decarboxylase [Enterococcus diestrammenae]KAF1295498.1 diphosphomevalonate decarboxylase [Enterococcus diestrammenae]